MVFDDIREYLMAFEVVPGAFGAKQPGLHDIYFPLEFYVKFPKDALANLFA